MPTLLSPRYWAAHLLGIAAVAVAVLLGVWQYNAWSDRREAEAVDLADAKAVPLDSLMSGDSPFPGASLGQPVTFAGEWLPDGTVYVEHRFLGERDGFWVVTPVLIGDSAIPVVRGWAPKATAPAPTGDVDLTGWLQASEGSGDVDKDPHDDVIPTMRIGSIVEHVDADLYSGYVVARDVSPTAATEDLEKVTPANIPAPSNFTALRNLLYAIQWWVFAAFAGFIWFRWGKDTLEALAATDNGAERVDA